MATKKELRDKWYECGDGGNFVFAFDDEGDLVAWCSACVTCDSWEIICFEGKLSHLIEAKESFKDRHSNCKPRQSEAKQEMNDTDTAKRLWIVNAIYAHISFSIDGDGNGFVAYCANCSVQYWLNKDASADKVLFQRNEFVTNHMNCEKKEEPKQEISGQEHQDKTTNNREKWNMIGSWKRKTGLDYLLFYDTMDGALSSICNVCKEKTEEYALRDAETITPELKDDIWGLKARIVSRHMGCGDKKERKEEQPNLERFPSGSIRDSQEGRGRYDLIPASSYKRLAIRTELGAKRYGDNNWKKGQPIERYLNSAKRHITEYELGENSEDHLSAASWNLFAAMWTEDEIKAGRLKT